MKTKAITIKKGDSKYYKFKECAKEMIEGILPLFGEEAE
jgi:hypothetical protein